jgi:acetyl-CoA C-acetyltransferase
MEKLAKLPPAFKKDGSVTAGNACGMNDAASAMIMTTDDVARDLGLKPLAHVKAYNVSGVDPNIMGIGPVPSINAILGDTGLALDQIDRFEINEAFAAQFLACEMELGLDREKVNVNGGGIALGHPVGATGARLVVSLAHGMAANGLKYGIASLCAGGGMGFSVLLERP